MNELKNIMIGGMPRSGTSLVSSIVAGQQELAMYPQEIGLHSDFRYRGLPDNEKSLRLVLSRIVGHTSLANRSEEIFRWVFERRPENETAAIRFALEWWREQNDKALWAFKHPGLERHALALMDVWKDTVFVYMVRDPRDVYVSTRSVKWRFRTPTRIAMTWRRSVSQALKVCRRYKDREVFLKYEDLVRSPGAELARLFSCAGLEASNDRLRFGQLDTFDGHNSEFSDITPYVISDKGVGRYKDRLDAHTEAVFLLFCGRAMKKLGYEADRSRVKWASLGFAALRCGLELPFWWIYNLLFWTAERLGFQYPFIELISRFVRLVRGGRQ